MVGSSLTQSANIPYVKFISSEGFRIKRSTLICWLKYILTHVAKNALQVRLIITIDQRNCNWLNSTRITLLLRT